MENDVTGWLEEMRRTSAEWRDSWQQKAFEFGDELEQAAFDWEAASESEETTEKQS